ASEATATAVNAGLRISHRNAKRTSARNESSTIICAVKGDTMIRRSTVTLVAAGTVYAVLTAAPSLTPDRILDYPFPDELVAAPAGSTIAWTFNERGVRNIYVAEAPEFRARRLTPYKEDDGQQ